MSLVKNVRVAAGASNALSADAVITAAAASARDTSDSGQPARGTSTSATPPSSMLRCLIVDDVKSNRKVRIKCWLTIKGNISTSCFLCLVFLTLVRMSPFYGQ